MKSILTVLLLFILGIQVSAQQRHYKISGQLQGNSDYKYAMLYQGFTRLGKFEIKNNSFEFSGDYLERDQWGRLATGYIYLVRQDLPGNFEILYPKGVIRRTIFFEAQSSIVFNMSDNKSFVKGGELNRVENIFSENEEYFSHKRDSACASLLNISTDSAGIDKKIRALKRSIYAEQQQKVLEIISQNLTSEASLINFLPFALVPHFTDSRARNTFDQFSNEIKSLKYGKRMDSLLTDLDQKMVKPKMKGLKMPPFELIGVNGKTMKSVDLFAKYTLIDFWASWCSPCRAENPNLKKAYDKYHDNGFNIISISIDLIKDKEKWLAAIQKDKTGNFMNLFDPADSPVISKQLNINAIPANYLVDSDGYIIETDLRGENLQNKLNEVFKKL